MNTTSRGLMVFLLAAVLAPDVGAQPPRAPLRVYGQILTDGVLLDESDPTFAGTVVSAWWHPQGTATQLASTTLVAGTPRLHRYLLNIPVGDGVTAPLEGSSVELHVGADTVLPDVVVTSADLRELDLFHVPGAYMTLVVPPTQVVFVGDTVGIQVQALAWTGEELITAPSANASRPIQFTAESFPAGASMGAFSGLITFTPTEAQAGRQHFVISAEVGAQRATEVLDVTVIPSACRGVTGVAEVCTAGQGVCAQPGYVTCDATTLATRCDATAGQPLPNELGGNGLDDNCNGQVDEGFGQLGSPCAVAGGNQCINNGTLQYAANGATLVCGVGGTPAPVNCVDQDDCTLDSCDPVTGCQHGPPVIGTRCGMGTGVCDVGNCVTVLPGMVCDSPRDLTLGTPLTLDFSTARDTLTLSATCAAPASAVDLFVRVAVPAGESLRVTATPGAGVDVWLALHQDACSSTCVDTSDVGAAGVPEEVSTPVDIVSQSWVVHVSTRTGNAGTVELRAALVAGMDGGAGSSGSAGSGSSMSSGSGGASASSSGMSGSGSGGSAPSSGASSSGGSTSSGGTGSSASLMVTSNGGTSTDGSGSTPPGDDPGGGSGPCHCGSTDGGGGLPWAGLLAACAWVSWRRRAGRGH